jgi:hypothetical protein
VSLLHRRWQRRVSLLASGALEGAEREQTLAHLDGCAACRREHEAARELLRLLHVDPVREAEPPIPLGALLTRVQARLGAAGPERRPSPAWRLGLASGGVLAVLALVLLMLPERRETPAATAPQTTERVFASEQALRRIERRMAREQAAVYLREAREVLLTMAAVPPCEKEDQRVDVQAEAERSRELLARRALLVEISGDDVMSARPVLEDVETVLREVAALESCARAGEVERLRREVEKRRLLMKISLMSRELLG